ncbi:MAG TPA: hypothetical protein VMA72_23885 [Streptosporangiaceae bacterium]|nr:hypothetical protein [Streptosporangiaceae bacterium]
MLIAAALCPAPPLLARELTGADPVVPELRRACLDAATDLLQSSPDMIAVVGTGEHTRAFGTRGQLDLAAYAPALALDRLDTGGLDGNAGPVPLPLGLGCRLLDEAGYAGQLALHTVSDGASAADCAALGARLAGTAARVALLVMADGSARRGLKAPGYLDERSFPFDAQVTDAIGAGDMAALLTLDADLARDLMATGRPAWQVLAGAVGEQRPASVIRYCDDPFGVAYLVATLSPQHDAIPTPGRERGGDWLDRP